MPSFAPTADINQSRPKDTKYPGQSLPCRPNTAPPRPAYVPNRPQAADGARINAISQLLLSPHPDLVTYEPSEVCLSHSNSSNNSTRSTALIDSGFSVNTVPDQSMLPTLVSSTGYSLIAAN